MFMEISSQLSVAEKKEKDLRRLKRLIDLAYRTREIGSIDIWLKSNRADIEAAHRDRRKVDRAIARSLKENVFVVHKFDRRPSVVYVTDSHLYPDLLRIAL